MALLNLADQRVRSEPDIRPRLGTAKLRPRSWQATAVEFIGALAVLIALSGGILMLRFGLIVLHDVVR